MNNRLSNPEQSSAPESLSVRWLRKLSILAAIAVCALVLLYPRAIAEDSSTVPHGWLVMLMFGMSICWLHGFNILPKQRLVSTLLPILGWIFLAIASWKIFF